MNDGGWVVEGAALITQQGMAPHMMTCHACGKEWRPRLTTESGLERVAREHWQECPPRPARVRFRRYVADA